MKRFLIAACFALQAFAFTHVMSQQLISYQLIQSFTTAQVDSTLAAQGLPTIILDINNGVDAYKVLYNTPYKHPDSLVQASGLLLLPHVGNCDVPLASYGHGTQSRRSRAASELTAGQWEVAMAYAADGYAICIPDGLGLGDYDPRVPIHPYIHAFSQANTSINMIRASREICTIEGQALNGQVFLFGYSQGGFTTMATHKEIELNHSAEFDLAGSAPMSGPYDLKEAQVDLIASDSVYPTPGYLPFIIFSYQSVYGNLYNTVDEAFKSPYDSILPIAFFQDDLQVGSINPLCTPVPKHMIEDSVVNAFLSDSLHPLRVDLADNDLIDGWVPNKPVKLIYCEGDDQVSYLNSVNAYNKWTNAGAPHLEQLDIGNFDHGDCAFYAFLGGKVYFDSLRVDCSVTNSFEQKAEKILVYTNTSNGRLNIEGLEADRDYMVWNSFGKKVRSGKLRVNAAKLDLSELAGGMYLLRLEGEGEEVVMRRLVVE
ncbi:MAG: lipase family protein [Bacteroidota bacterium]